MNDARWLALVQRIADTVDDEISCSECLDEVSTYVDVEMTGQNAARQFPRLKQHLDQCRVCCEEYEILHDLIRLHAEDRLSSANKLQDELK